MEESIFEKETSEIIKEENRNKNFLEKILENSLAKYFIFYLLTSMSWLFSLFIKENINDLILSGDKKMKLKFFIPFLYKEKKEYFKKKEELKKKKREIQEIISNEGDEKKKVFLNETLSTTISEEKRNENNKIEEKYTFAKEFTKKSNIIFWSGMLITLYSSIVFAHIFVERYLTNDLIMNLKKKIMEKYFKLKGTGNEKENEKKAMVLINDDVKKFSSYHYFGINQIYYLALDTCYFLIRGWKGDSKNGWVPIICFLIHIAICVILCFFSYKWESINQKSAEEEEDKAKEMISNNLLIIKKNEENKFLNNYKKMLKKTRKIINLKRMFDTFQMVIPSYLVIKYINYIFIIFGNSNEKKFIGLYFLFHQLLSDSGKMIERLKEYPSFFSSKQRIKSFLQEKERNDIQKNIILNECEKIIIENLNFSYKNNKNKDKNIIFKNFKLTISKGKINLIEGSNGFGKSTLINLILGIFKADSGNIIIYDGKKNHEINEINLKEWRKIIGYCENNNLLKNEELSTGQKQLLDFEKIEKEEGKKIIILDEADSTLDKENRKIFFEKIKKISKNKIVILVTHKSEEI